MHRHLHLVRPTRRRRRSDRPRPRSSLRPRQPPRRRDPQLDPPALAPLPDTGGEALHEKEARARGALVPAPAARGDLLPHRLRQKVLALAEAQHEDVVLGEQPDARPNRAEVSVACKDNVSGRALHLGLLELVAERVEERPSARCGQEPRHEPLAEGARPHGAVGAHEAPAGLAKRLVRVDLPPPGDPLVGPDERHLRSSRRALAEPAEEEAEPGEQPLPRLRANPLHHLLGDLLARQATAVEHVEDRRLDRLDLLRCERRVHRSLRVAPRPDDRRIRRGSTGEDATRRMPHAQLGRRVEMERATQRPRLHERARLPEGGADVRARHPVDPRRELELGRRLNLSLHPAEVACDIQQPGRRRHDRRATSARPAARGPRPRSRIARLDYRCRRSAGSGSRSTVL